MRSTRTAEWQRAFTGLAAPANGSPLHSDVRHAAVAALALAASLAGVACHSSAPTEAASQSAPGVIGYVAGAPIPAEALEARYAAQLPAFAGPDGTVTPLAAQSARLRISEELVDEALVEAAAATRGVTVGEDEIDARVEPGAGDEARARVRRELLVDRLAGVAEEPPSDVLVEAFYADNILAFVPVGAPSGTAPRPLAQVREEIRAFVGASLRAARRDALRRELRFTIPFTNTVALALGDLEPPRLEDIVLGVPPSSANPASLSIVVPRSASGSLR
jgi:hypothetical protein